MAGHVYRKGDTIRGAKIRCDDVETTTLFDGSYELSNLKPGTYDVIASLKGFQTQTKKIEVREESVVYLDFQLQKSVGTAKLFGCVYDYNTKKPLSLDGTVILILPVSNLYAYVDKNGCFEFTSLSADEYEIFVSVTGYEEAKSLIAIGEGEQVNKDFYIKPLNIEEPPWG